jgi:hypothetical protein
MNAEEYHRELCAFDEKIELGELEVAKASTRVAEIKYMKARFQLDAHTAMCKAVIQPRPSDISNPQMGELSS